eukprot:6409775-Prymnesium_polylepis.1
MWFLVPGGRRPGRGLDYAMVVDLGAWGGSPIAGRWGVLPRPLRPLSAEWARRPALLRGMDLYENRPKGRQLWPG